MDELYTVNELSEKLKYSRSTIYRWIEEGSIPYQRMGRQIRFTENDVLSIGLYPNRCTQLSGVA